MHRRLPLLIDPDELAIQLGDPSLRILDSTVALRRDIEGGPYEPVSGRQAYASAHIPGASFADLIDDLADPSARFPFAVPSVERFARKIGALGVGTGTHVVVYAQEGPMWATRLWWLLRYFGFDDVSVLDGGLLAWRAAGRPLSDEPVRRTPARFRARRRTELLATREDVERIVAGQPACLVNALPGRVFRGEGATSYSRPGRIPGSVSVPWEDLVDPATNLFRSPHELDRALGEVGAVDGDRTVVYCGGGISATVDVFALAVLGRDDVQLYDGSLTEWTADPALPVEVG
jgi:thiosulfate/3-mercaptopyruvate sulfurtransferase